MTAKQSDRCPLLQSARDLHSSFFLFLSAMLTRRFGKIRTPEAEDVGEKKDGAGHPKMSEADLLRESEEVLTTRLKKRFNRCFLKFVTTNTSPSSTNRRKKNKYINTNMYIYVYK